MSVCPVIYSAGVCWRGCMSNEILPSDRGVERRRTPRDREFHAQLRPLARYQPQPEHEALAEGLLLEARLRARLLVRPLLSAPHKSRRKSCKEEAHYSSSPVRLSLRQRLLLAVSYYYMVAHRYLQSQIDAGHDDVMDVALMQGQWAQSCGRSILHAEH